MKKNELSLKREDCRNRALVGEFILLFIQHDSFCRELKSNFMQNLAKEGLLHVFSKVFFNIELKTVDLIPWFMDRVFTDLLMHQNSSQEEWKEFLDLLSGYDMKFLETHYELARKYDLKEDELKNDFRSYLMKIINGDDKSSILLSLFADCVLHSEINILSYCYQDWFKKKYSFGK